MERILCLDDDRRTLDTVVDYLRIVRPGVVVEGTGGPGCARERLEAGRFDCLVSDGVLTDEGEPFVALARRLSPDLPIVLYTGSIAGADPPDTVPAAVDRVVRKGDRIEFLGHAVEQVVDGRSDGGRRRGADDRGTEDRGEGTVGGDEAGGRSGEESGDVPDADPGSGLDGAHWTRLETVDWSRHDAPDAAIVFALERAHGRFDDGAVLYDAVDGDALATFLRSAAGNAAVASVQFDFGDLEVRVESDGGVFARRRAI